MPRIKTRTVLFLFFISFASFVAFSMWDDSSSSSKNALTSSNSERHVLKSDSLGQSDQDISNIIHENEVVNQKLTKENISPVIKTTWSGSFASLLKESDQIPWLGDKNVLRPWFMEKGGLRPDNKYFSFDSLPIWPDEEPDSDRIVNQLMYRPPNYVDSEQKKMKKILLYFGRGGWSPRDLPMGRTRFLRDNCPVNTCELSMDMNDAETADAIFFKDRFQPPRHRRHPKQVWILFLLECPTHTQSFRNLNHVLNWTATYRHDSDIVAPYEKWFSPFQEHIPRKASQSTSVKKNKKVAWFVSNCGAKNKRLEYAIELGKHIEVDIYGGCGHKRCPRTQAKHCFELLDKEYKFYLAFENSNCKDYLTEKFYVNGLMNDILPIVMGARPVDYVRHSPSNSYIHVDDFASPKELAVYLDEVDKNDTLYNSYFDWKGTGEFVNTYFWCRLCAMLHSPRATKESRSYGNMHEWWAGPGVCQNQGWNKRSGGVS